MVRSGEAAAETDANRPGYWRSAFTESREEVYAVFEKARKERIWDAIQTALDYAALAVSFVPGVGLVIGAGIEIGNATISFYRGNKTDAWTRVAFALPGAIQGAKLVYGYAGRGLTQMAGRAAAKRAARLAAKEGAQETCEGLVKRSAGSGFNRRAVLEGFHEHHIISYTNRYTKNHDLLDLAGFNLHSRKNKIFLPTRESLHPTRSLHLGRHRNAVSKRIAKKMDKIVLLGKRQGWTQQRYNAALRRMLSKERQALKSGARALNKNCRPWSI